MYYNVYIYYILWISMALLFVWVLFLKKNISRLETSCEIHENEKEAILSFLEKMGTRSASLSSIEETLTIIVDFITSTTNAQAGAIFLLDKDTQTLSAKVVQGPFPPLQKTQSYVFTKRKFLIDKIKKDKIKIGEGIIGRVAESGVPILISDTKNDPRVPNLKTDFISMESLMLAPLTNRGSLLGVFAVVNKKNNQKFDDNDMEMLKSLANQAAITVNLAKLYEDLSNNQRLEQELKVAYEFQRMLLPKECPETPFLDIAVYNKPALEVGGDYYDFFWVDEDNLGFVIADVSGKGIPGALIMSMVRSTVRAESTNCLSPKAVLAKVNERILKDTKDNVFITMTYGIIDLKNMKMKFVRAGHEPIILLDEFKEDYNSYAPEGIALGLVPDKLFDVIEEVEINLKPGNTAVLYTDGVIEALNDEVEEYGKERFINTLKENFHENPNQIIDKIVSDINKFTKGIEQQDDITLLAIKVKENIQLAKIA